jgi:hypothetical protein
MALIRVVFLEFLLCTHVIGAAVLFRRLFPRESPWLCYLVPILALLSTLNCIEYFIPLSNLGWLLPFTLGGLIWVILSGGYSWEGLRFPTIFFVCLFNFTFALKCIAPVISNATEGVSNLTRILNYSLGGGLPQIDSFLPPYSYANYYSFQHYGAAILERLFNVDLGTAYNVSYAFLLAWVCLNAAGVAHSISGKMWISIATTIVILAGWTGSCPYLIIFGHGPDYDLSTNLNEDWDKPDHNPLAWICAHDQYHPALLLQAPMINLYWSEFHSTISGHFVTMASLLACSEAFKVARTSWCWICLVAIPLVAIISSAWFFVTVFTFCSGTMMLALMAGRRPDDWKFVCLGSLVAIALLWPSVLAVTGMTEPINIHWTNPDEHTPLWMFLIQWWPVYLPWLFLCFVWNRLDLPSRWLHFAIPLLFIAIEFVTFGDRKLTTEKIWASIYGAGLVTLMPMIFMRKGIAFRILGLIIFLLSPFCLAVTLYEYYPPLYGPDAQSVLHLEGNEWILGDSQKKRLMDVLHRLHGATILPGRSFWNFSQAPAVVDYSENRCWVGYTHHEFDCGRGAEADQRSKIDNEFYDGKMPNPLVFLRANNISAVMIWPEDNIPDSILQQFQNQLGPEFFYIDCKLDGPNNAGLFIRQSDLEPYPGRSGYPPGMNVNPQ